MSKLVKLERNVVGTVFVSQSNNELFILWGDGKHDDGPALRALERGEAVYLPDGTRITSLPKGTFYDFWENPVDMEPMLRRVREAN
jgi:hypothetical protein